MKISRRAQIAFAVGWFVLVDILLRTTDGAVGYINNTSTSIRGIVYGFGLNDSALVFGLVGLFCLGLLALLALRYLWRAWSTVISITRALVSFFFYQNPASEDEGTADKDLLNSLFGGDTVKSQDSSLKEGLFWRSLKSLLMIWAILLLSAIIIGLINVISRY